MSILLVSTFGTLAILLGKFLFKKWFNHLSLYTLIWMVMIILYEMKLLPFLDLSVKTWLIVVGAFISFLLGILTIFSARSIFPRQEDSKNNYTRPALFLDGGKKIRFLLLVFSVIGLYASLQHWSVLLNQYGSLANIFLHANEIYTGRISNEEVKGVIPYIWLFAYFAVFLGGLYSAYKGRVTLLALIPILAIILKETARFTRSGILFGLLEFTVSFMLFRHYLSNSETNKTIPRLKIFFTTAIIITLMVIGATLVKIVRNPIDSFQGSNSKIGQLNSTGIISPSVYFYGASQVGVLNVFLRDNNEQVLFGNSTFLTLYNLIAKFEVIPKPETFQRGYYIPYWSNTATYLRDLLADFGISGALIFPFLTGLLTTFFWFRYYNYKKSIDYVILVYLYILITISFFTLATRFTPWVYGLLLFLFLIPAIEKINLSQISK